MKSNYKYLPLIIALALLSGVLGGIWIGKKYSTIPMLFSGDAGKVESLLHLIDQEYVETVDMKELTENAIREILGELDPHSVYIPKEDLVSVNEELEGSFSGIGVQFSIQKDTIMIVQVIAGGPSEKVGLLPGDRIVEVEDSLFVGKNITNEKVMKKLKGKKGSKVKLGIHRTGHKKTIPFTITRGNIPVKSVLASFVIKPGIGYIKVDKFGQTTYQEFITAIAQLKQEKASSFIVDLRGNSGGYLEAAAKMINEFLPAGDLIVYTEGKAFPRNDALANGTGSCQHDQVVILIDEMSASASEIFAGAIQDNDRGLVIGRRSFGKGLVQNQLPLTDGSAVRLTIARYYTPSGRCIQKPYKSGKDADYEEDIINRYLHGEFFSKDSIKLPDSLQFKTKTGRIVYSAGGIMPDIFIARDTIGYTSYYSSLISGSLLYEFALKYTDDKRKDFKKYADYKALKKYLDQDNLPLQLATYAFQSQSLRIEPAQLQKSSKLINTQLSALICRNIFDDNAFYAVWNQDDNILKAAIKAIESGKAKAPIMPDK